MLDFRLQDLQVHEFHLQWQHLKATKEQKMSSQHCCTVSAQCNYLLCISLGKNFVRTQTYCLKCTIHCSAWCWKSCNFSGIPLCAWQVGSGRERLGTSGTKIGWKWTAGFTGLAANSLSHHGESVHAAIAAFLFSIN